VGALRDQVVTRRLIFGSAPNESDADEMRMACLVTRNNRFYVVVYDGIDRITGLERRRWHPARRITYRRRGDRCDTRRCRVTAS